MAKSSLFVLLSSVLANLVAGEFGLGAQSFMLSGDSSVNNAKLDWELSSVGSATYEVQRSDGTSSAFRTLATVTGNTYDDYNLPSTDEQYYYQVIAFSDGSSVDQSSVAIVQPFSPSGSYYTFDNTQSSQLVLKPNLTSDGVAYRFLYQEYSNGSMSAIVQQTATDGYTFTGDRVVLSGSTACASVANESCHMERITFIQNPTTGQFVMWGHFEDTANYGLAQVAVAAADPGQDFTFIGTYRPLGYDSRDLTFFADPDSTSAYLISSYDVNTNINIYGLDASWTNVTSVVAEVYPNQYREAPAMAKFNGTYFLFTSRASGWFPSLPEYITATDISGPWSNASVMGNTATFATQSGEVDELDDAGSFVMRGDRWSANWTPAQPPSRQLLLPLSMDAQQGFTTGHYYPSVKYIPDAKSAGQAVFGVQNGQILSVGKTATSNAGSENINLANDGIQTDPSAFFTPSQTPFWYQIDLGDSYQISQVDLTTQMVQGSETYYGFNVTGSNDGSTFELIVDRASNMDVGFVASTAPQPGSYRYVRLNVDTITNTHNQGSATWAAGLQEVTVYGTAS